MHLHRWVVVETIGNVVTEQCTRCPKRRTRVRGPQIAPAACRVVGCPDDPVIGSRAISGPSTRIFRDARQGGGGAG